MMVTIEKEINMTDPLGTPNLSKVFTAVAVATAIALGLKNKKKISKLIGKLKK